MNVVRVPAVALLLKFIVASPTCPPISKFCMMPELFSIPLPMSDRLPLVPMVMVNALALELNVMLSTRTFSRVETSVTLETSKVAISLGPLGTVCGIQFAAVFQSGLTGLRFQVALPAEANCATSGESSVMSRTDGRDVGDFIFASLKKNPRQGKEFALLEVRARLSCFAANGAGR